MIAVAAIAVTVPVAVAARDGKESGHPRLAVAKRSPLVIRGVGFRSRELVTVSVRANQPIVKRVRSTPAGAFGANMGTVVVDHCSALFVRAVGNEGSEAILKLPRPACMPARNP